MATRSTRTSTKSAAPVVEEAVEATTATAEPTVKSQINAGIAKVADALKVDAKDRYKVQRAIAFIAFRSAIEDGTFDELLEATIADAGELPAGWALEAAVAAPKAAPKAKVAPKATAVKGAAKTPAKATAATPARAARKRPQR